ncbi:hypothetical protein EJD97_001680 [Solanum chilense]|uniref:Uncharacterized protein n=1 Tax=Solanum chilense TaxID=4083 RepID=A0A6N2ANX5_SOLCI|nr:hypothetical protein EJD97_001680 [Solanum chilense]
MQKRPHTELVTVRHACSAPAEGRWGSLTKCGVTESMTVYPAVASRVMKRAAEEIAQVWDDGVHDGPS